MKEIRSITGQIEIRSEGEGEMMPTISGYACVFNQATDMGWFMEQVDSRAFEGCDMSMTIAAFNHDEDELLSRVTGDPTDLVLTVDEKGLKYEFKAKNECAQEVAQNIALKFIQGSSFAFTVDEESWEYNVKQPSGVEKDVRTIKKIGTLYDVSPVVFPAYIQTSAEMRSVYEANKPKQIQAQKTVNELRLQLRKTK